MVLGLCGRLVLVTGSTRGIGRATAAAFLEEHEPTSLLQRFE